MDGRTDGRWAGPQAAPQSCKGSPAPTREGCGLEKRVSPVFTQRQSLSHQGDIPLQTKQPLLSKALLLELFCRCHFSIFTPPPPPKHPPTLHSPFQTILQ